MLLSSVPIQSKLMAIPAEYHFGTLSDCKFICKAADTPVGHADELVQHHARHVALGEVGDGSSLAKLNLIEAEVGEGGVDDVVVAQHHAFWLCGRAAGEQDGDNVIREDTFAGD